MQRQEPTQSLGTTPSIDPVLLQAESLLARGRPDLQRLTDLNGEMLQRLGLTEATCLQAMSQQLVERAGIPSEQLGRLLGCLAAERSFDARAGAQALVLYRKAIELAPENVALLLQFSNFSGQVTNQHFGAICGGDVQAIQRLKAAVWQEGIHAAQQALQLLPEREPSVERFWALRNIAILSIFYADLHIRDAHFKATFREGEAHALGMQYNEKCEAASREVLGLCQLPRDLSKLLVSVHATGPAHPHAQRIADALWMLARAADNRNQLKEAYVLLNLAEHMQPGKPERVEHLAKISKLVNRVSDLTRMEFGSDGTFAPVREDSALERWAAAIHDYRSSLDTQAHFLRMHQKLPRSVVEEHLVSLTALRTGRREMIDLFVERLTLLCKGNGLWDIASAEAGDFALASLQDLTTRVAGKEFDKIARNLDSAILAISEVSEGMSFEGTEPFAQFFREARAAVK
jgi:hypothetical protein